MKEGVRGRAHVAFASRVEQRDMIAKGGPVKVIQTETEREIGGCEYTSERVDICFIWSVESVIVILMLFGLAAAR